MALAEKYKIEYPNPAGGCFLCEKEPATRLKTLLKKDLINEKTLPLTMIGRHFFADDTWLIVARDEAESNLITKFKTSIKDAKGKPAIYYDNKKGKGKALELQKVYSTGYSKEERNKFEEVKL